MVMFVVLQKISNKFYKLPFLEALARRKEG